MLCSEYIVYFGRYSSVHRPCTEADAYVVYRVHCIIWTLHLCTYTLYGGVRLCFVQSTLYNLDATVLYIDLVRKRRLMLCTEYIVYFGRYICVHIPCTEVYAYVVYRVHCTRVYVAVLLKVSV